MYKWVKATKKVLFFKREKIHFMYLSEQKVMKIINVLKR